MYRRGDAVMDVVTSSCRTRTTKKTRRGRAAHSRRARPPPTATARPPMTDRTRVAKKNARYVVARGSALLQRPSARSRVAQSPPQPTSFVPCASLLWSCVQANFARMRQRVVEERRQKAHAASQAAAAAATADEEDGTQTQQQVQVNVPQVRIRHVSDTGGATNAVQAWEALAVPPLLF